MSTVSCVPLVDSDIGAVAFRYEEARCRRRCRRRRRRRRRCRRRRCRRRRRWRRRVKVVHLLHLLRHRRRYQHIAVYVHMQRDHRPYVGLLRFANSRNGSATNTTMPAQLPCQKTRLQIQDLRA